MQRVEEQGKRHRRRAAAIPALVLAALALVLALPAAATATTPEYKLTIGVVGHGEVKCRIGAEPVVACLAQYPEGTEVELVPVPEPSWEFEEWGGDCEGQPEECLLTIEEDHSVTADFKYEPPEFPLDIEEKGEGEGWVEIEKCVLSGEEVPCDGEYLEGTKVTLAAEREAKNTKFIGWSDDCAAAGTTPTCTVTMSAPRKVTATFAWQEFALEVKTTPKETGTVECEAESGREKCQEKYPWEMEVTILPALGSSFSACKVDGVAQPPDKCEVEMTEPHSVVVTFGLEPTPEYALTVNENGTGSGTVKCKVNGGSATTCASKYTQGTSIEFVQGANSGSEFAGWGGDCTGAGACSLTMSAAHSVTATFNTKEEPPTPEEFTLTVKRGGTGSGTLTSSPAGINCGATCSAKYEGGAAVTLTPTPDEGSEFKRWFGGGCDSQATCTTTMNGTKTVEAIFTTTEPAAPEAKKGRVRVARRVATVRGGRALLELRCVGGPCQGRLKLVATVRMNRGTRQLVVGRLAFGLASGEEGTFRVRLAGPLARRELTRRGKLRAWVQGSGVVKSTLKLRNAKTRRKR